MKTCCEWAEQVPRGSVYKGRCPLHSEQSAYVLHLIRKKKYLADNLHDVRFLLWFYILSFILMLSFDFVHFILGILGKEFYVIRSSYVRTVLASGPYSFVFYLPKRARP
jgi:hypothetical protein